MNPQCFFLVSLACFFVHLLVAQAQAVPSVYFNLDLSTQTYDDLWTSLRRQLRQWSATAGYKPDNVFGRYVLGPRRPDFHGTPLGWIMIQVTTGQAAEVTTLAIAKDDLYLLGFRNSSGDWYILRDFAGLPDATTIPFSESYYDLVGGHLNLPTVPLGKQSAIEAVKVLASCDHFDTTTTAQVKQAMARFVVMISEAARFTKIRNAFSSSQKWERKTFIAEEEAKPVVHWGKLSTLLVIWKRDLRWDYGRAEDVKGAIGVQGPQDALNLVDFLLRPRNI